MFFFLRQNYNLSRIVSCLTVNWVRPFKYFGRNLTRLEIRYAITADKNCQFICVFVAQNPHNKIYRSDFEAYTHSTIKWMTVVAHSRMGVDSITILFYDYFRHYTYILIAAGWCWCQRLLLLLLLLLFSYSFTISFNSCDLWLLEYHKFT